jgi:hypothetical protein
MPIHKILLVTILLFINSIQTFSQSSDSTATKNKKGLGKNIFSLQPIKVLGIDDEVYLLGNIAYERIFMKGYLGLRLGGYVAFDQTTAGVAYELKVYPTGQNKLKYYTGIGGKSGLLYYTDISGQDGDSFNSIQILNGIQYAASKHFTIGLNTGIGMGFLETKVSNGYVFKNTMLSLTAYNAGIMLGFRF